MCVLFLQGLKLCAVFCVNKKKLLAKRAAECLFMALLMLCIMCFEFSKRRKKAANVVLCTAHKCSVILFMGYKMFTSITITKMDTTRGLKRKVGNFPFTRYLKNNAH